MADPDSVAASLDSLSPPPFDIPFDRRSPDYELVIAGTLFYRIENSPDEREHPACFW
jgi:hypothetical protein